MNKGNVQKAIIINGSIRKDKTSNSFAMALQELTTQKGGYADVFHAIDVFEGRESIEDLLEKLSEIDLLVLVAPLYVDTLPYIDLWLLEQLDRKGRHLLEGKKMLAIGQCGFPEVELNEPLLETCRLFARHMGMSWLGGLGYGGGPLIDGRPLRELGRKGRKIIKGLDLALSAAFLGQTVPKEAQSLLTLRISPLLLKPLAVLLNYKLRKEGRRHGNHSLLATPYKLK